MLLDIPGMDVLFFARLIHNTPETVPCGHIGRCRYPPYDEICCTGIMSTAQIITQAPAPTSTSHDQSLTQLSCIMQDGTLTPKQLGHIGETYAATWLEHHGWRILSRNWHTRYGELDIVGLTKERSIAFVEVKTRRSLRCGIPQEAVDARKQASLRRAGVQWLLEPEHRIAHHGIRFDVISIIVRGGRPLLHHIPGAF